MKADLIIKNGWIIDGVTSKRFKGDIAIIGDKISEIGCLNHIEADETIDATNKFICPGFIDVHSHSDISLLHNGKAKGKLAQGITTEVIGNCGYSPFPLNSEENMRSMRRNQMNFIDIPDKTWNFNSFSDYCMSLINAKPAVNVSILVGYGSIRSFVASNKKEITIEEQAEILKILEEILSQGAVGLSVGLAYPPDCFSTFDELVQAGKVLAKYNKVFTFHIRSDRKFLFESICEAAEIGLLTNASIQISHIKAPSLINHGRSAELLALLKEYQEKGVDITADFYPYTAGSTTLSILFPHSFLAYAPEDFIKLLEQNDFKDSASKTFKSFVGILSEEDGENIIVSSSPSHHDCIGMSLKKIAIEWSLDLEETVLKLYSDDCGKTEIIIYAQDDADLINFLNSPDCFICTDGIALDIEDNIRRNPHPRYFGSFPKALIQISPDNIETFIRKVCVSPARKFGMKNRGMLKCGFFADITIIDLTTLSSQAEYINPKVYSTGIDTVIVNGKITYHNMQVLNCCGTII